MVGDDYEGSEAHLADGLGLGVAYRDPGHRPGYEAGVSIFGLRNFVMPIGNQFLELVAPQPGVTDSAGGRYMDRRGGPGGYMLLFQVPRADYASYRTRMNDLGSRIVAGDDITSDTSEAIHMHPKDLPGCIVEVRWCENEDRPDGDWWPVETDWRDHSHTEIVDGICGAEIQTPDPTGLADRWAAALGLEVVGSATGPTLVVDDAAIRFVEPSDGRPEGLGAIDLSTPDADAAAARAAAAGVPVAGHTLTVSGLRMHLVESTDRTKEPGNG